MKILITGGAGFIGSNFARHIIRNRPDWGVTVLDKLTYAGNPANVADLKSYDRFQFVQGDICDPHLMAETIPGHDCIVNFAAETHVDRSLARADDFLRTALIGTNVMLEIVRKHKDIRYIQISTDEVYGSFDIGSATEESPIVPRNPYSASKAGGDLLALSYFKSFGLDVIVTRSSNNFGPFQYPEKVMPLFITNLLEGKPIPLYGDGMNIRDWLFVEDNCTAILLALEEGNAGEVYNIGAGNEIPNIKMTKALLASLGKPESMIRLVEDRPGHDRRYSLESTKIRSMGWEPASTFQDQLASTVSWYQSHEDWWKPLKSGEFKEYYKKMYEERKGYYE